MIIRMNEEVFKEFQTVSEIVKRGGVLEPLYNASFEMSLSGVAMILEELCKKNGKDILEVIDNLRVIAEQVQNEYGKY